jgi:hypothetical protein
MDAIEESLFQRNVPGKWSKHDQEDRDFRQAVDYISDDEHESEMNQQNEL